MKLALPNRGMTAIEVLASTILSALLMTALIGVLRGLKAHEKTLQERRPVPPWQESLEASFAADLQHAVTYQSTPQSLILTGHGGRNEDGYATWTSSQVVYEIQQTETTPLLVRRELPVAGGSSVGTTNLALTGAAEIWTMTAAEPASDGEIALTPPSAPPASVSTETPLPAQLTIELRSPQGETLFRYRHRRL